MYLGNFKPTFKIVTKFLAVDARKPFRWLIPTFIITVLLQVPAGKENCLIFFLEKLLLFPRCYKINSRTLQRRYGSFVFLSNDAGKYLQPKFQIGLKNQWFPLHLILPEICRHDFPLKRSLKLLQSYLYSISLCWLCLIKLFCFFLFKCDLRFRCYTTKNTIQAPGIHGKAPAVLHSTQCTV